jgi:hypothetical protein
VGLLGTNGRGFFVIILVTVILVDLISYKHRIFPLVYLLRPDTFPLLTIA